MSIIKDNYFQDSIIKNYKTPLLRKSLKRLFSLLMRFLTIFITESYNKFFSLVISSPFAL